MADRHDAPDSRQTQRLVAVIEKWSAQPRFEANLRVLAILGASMVSITLVSWGLPNRDSFLRNTALAFVALHGLLHWTLVWSLTRLRDQGLPSADAMLRKYLEPRRMTHLDSAASWLAFAAFVPVLSRLVIS